MALTPPRGSADAEIPRQMDSGKSIAVGERRRMTTADTVLYSALAVLGLSFWFFLGFPYANHNESFAIVAQLRTMGLGDALTQIVYPVANYRPLGQAVAWGGYRIGNTIFPVEVFNYLGAVAAWVVLFIAARERRTFALCALIVGGALFTGYIYLFHLHGVFYSPLLLLIAMLFWVDRDFTRSRVIALSLCALVAAFFHPYALAVYAIGLAGMAFGHRGKLAGLKAIVAACVTAALALFIGLVLSERRTGVRGIPEMYDGLIVSYQMVEINLIVSAAALLLAVATAFSLPEIAKLKGITAIATALVGVIFIYFGIPVLFLWIAMCLLKVLLLKQWWMALVLTCTAIFPAPTATGSPTYVVFVLMVCAAILPYGWTSMEQRLGASTRIGAAVAIAAAAVLLILLRSGIEVPVVSRIAQPLIAEREKTFQMEEIVQWHLSSQYADYPLIFVRDASNPTDASDTIDRTFRPPTNQKDLFTYERGMGDHGPAIVPAGKHLVVGFGGDSMPPGETLLVLPAQQAGEARVVLPNP
ncbi:hypothetical protein [Mycobacterium neglectum]|uniref:hypothetical protein n=1 Tax=Mycobacterium neglectum TaxID=242737 RepID=UPI0011460A22|nr:hypothetical protein [Mycobacterium neglectum]